MNGSEAEVRRRREVTRSQDCVGQLEECIGALIEECMESRAECSQTRLGRVFFCHRLLARIFTFGSAPGRCLLTSPARTASQSHSLIDFLYEDDPIGTVEVVGVQGEVAMVGRGVGARG